MLEKNNYKYNTTSVESVSFIYKLFISFLVSLYFILTVVPSIINQLARYDLLESGFMLPYFSLITLLTLINVDVLVTLILLIIGVSIRKKINNYLIFILPFVLTIIAKVMFYISFILWDYTTLSMESLNSIGYIISIIDVIITLGGLLLCFYFLKLYGYKMILSLIFSIFLLFIIFLAYEEYADYLVKNQESVEEKKYSTVLENLKEQLKELEKNGFELSYIEYSLISKGPQLILKKDSESYNAMLYLFDSEEDYDLAISTIPYDGKDLNTLGNVIGSTDYYALDKLIIVINQENRELSNVMDTLGYNKIAGSNVNEADSLFTGMNLDHINVDQKIIRLMHNLRLLYGIEIISNNPNMLCKDCTKDYYSLQNMLLTDSGSVMMMSFNESPDSFISNLNHSSPFISFLHHDDVKYKYIYTYGNDVIVLTPDAKENLVSAISEIYGEPIVSVEIESLPQEQYWLNDEILLNKYIDGSAYYCVGCDDYGTCIDYDFLVPVTVIDENIDLYCDSNFRLMGTP